MSEDHPLFGYAVGELYHAGRTSWPERPDLSIGTHGVELRLFLSDPTAQEIDGVRRGRARFAWIEGEHAAMLCYRMTARDGSGVPWGDVTYHAGRQTAQQDGLPGETGTPILARILLIDADSGILRAVRVVSWPARVSDAIRATIGRQLARGYNPQAELLFAEAMHSRYPGMAGTRRMVAERADHTWSGGEVDPSAAPAADASAQSAVSDGAAQQVDPAQVLARTLAGITVPGRRYPSALPAELERWYCYVVDGGHSIAVVVASLIAPGTALEQWLVPAPVKAVLAAGWEVREGFVVSDLPYDAGLGLRTDPEHDEF